MMSTDVNARFWQQASARLARWVNFGWWLSQWITWWMVAGLAGALGILVTRRYFSFYVSWAWITAGTLVVLGALTAWLKVRGRFERAEQARIRLEDAYSLKARLSAAAEGVGNWPAPVTELAPTLRLRWRQPAKVMGIVVAMLLLASFIPITNADLNRKHLIERPPAAQDVQQWVNQLREKKAVSDQSLDEVEKKMDELLRRPSENWYEHGSLEAAGSLKEQTAESLREMSRNLADAERAANALEKLGGSLPQAAKDALSKSLKDASDGLRSGDMKPNESLLDQLQKATEEGSSGMSKEEMDKLKKHLEQALKDLKEALENSPDIKLSEVGISDGSGDGDNPDENGKEDNSHEESKEPGKPGRGGTRRGPAPAPLSLKNDPTDLETKNLEKLKAKTDPTRLAPGDTVGITNGKHKVDKKAYQGAQGTGGVDSTGEGGAAIWQNNLIPEEREALKNYFK